MWSPTLDQLRVRVYDRKGAGSNSQTRSKQHPVVEHIPTTMNEEEESAVIRLLSKQGLISRCGKEEVYDRDIQRLRPGEWLNDVIMNSYGQMIVARSQHSRKRVNGGGKGRAKLPNVHYLNTFFWERLNGLGYEKGGLARWTKKVM